MGAVVMMEMMLIQAALLVTCFQYIDAYKGPGPFLKYFPPGISSQYNHSVRDVGEPLFITPLLESGKWKQAQELSVVKLDDAPPVKSHSGFITVNKKYNSNLFFWYFPAEYKP